MWEELDFGFASDSVTPPAPTAGASFTRPQTLELDEFDDPRPSERLFSDLEPGTSFTIPFESDPDHQTHTIVRSLSEWPAQFPVALAMDVEDEDAILDRFGVTREKYELLKPLPAFRKALAEAQKSLREQGHTFKLKCAGIAEEFLDELYRELYNPGVGLTTKIDVVKWMTKMGGLEPPPVKDTSSGSGAVQVAIQINL